jgi:ATP-dependent Lon protease
MKAFPLISVRDITIFPNSLNPLQIGRPFTLASIKESLSKFEDKIVVTSQRLIEINDRPDMNQIFATGCLCKIEAKVEFPDGSMKILIKAESRFKIQSVEDKDWIRYCKGEIVPRFNQDLENEKKRSILKQINANKNDWPEEILRDLPSLEKTEESFEFIMRVGHLLTTRLAHKKELSLDQIREGIFIIDTLSNEEKKVINLNLARVQEVLESDNAKDALKKIETLLM